MYDNSMIDMQENKFLLPYNSNQSIVKSYCTACLFARIISPFSDQLYQFLLSSTDSFDETCCLNV